MSQGAEGSVRKIVVISDLHCGSTVGLLPPGVSGIEGNEFRQNAAQAWLWQAWSEFWQWCYGRLGDSPWALVINGDAIEGVHHGTKQVVSPEISDHMTIALAALEEHAERATKRFVIAGTEAHTGNREHTLAAMLGAEMQDGRAHDRLDLDVGGCLVRFVHHISTTSRVYLAASRLSIHLGNLQLECLRAGHPVPHVLCAAHCHRFDEYTDGKGLAVTSPAWQLLTRYGHKVVPAAIPVVGGYMLEWRDGELLPRVEARLFTTEANRSHRL